MAVESTTYISGLNTALPTATDSRAEGDDHLRLLKSTIKATFPNITAAVTPTHLELNYVAGVTSAIQTQFTGVTTALALKADKASPTFTGTVVLPAATSIGGVSATEIGRLAGVTGPIQTQLDNKISAISPGLTGTPTAPTAAPGTNTTQIATTAFVAAQAFLTALPAQTGNAGKFVTTNGASASWGAVSTGAVQEFTASGTWTKPAGKAFHLVEVWSGGGGGGSGMRGASGAIRTGGGAGGGGAYNYMLLLDAQVGATVTVTIGAGGAGGAARTVNSTPGAAGADGGHSSFGSLVRSYGGGGGGGGAAANNAAYGGGGGGTTGAGQANTGGAPVTFSAMLGGFGGDMQGSPVQSQLGGAGFGGGAGGWGDTANITTGTGSAKGGAGGGGGGCLDAGNQQTGGSAGGAAFVATGGGGSAGAATGQAGTAGSSMAGGGGGYPGNSGGTIAGGAGGAGGTAAGGGGGGASTNGANSGAGGAGGNGLVRIYSW